MGGNCTELSYSIASPPTTKSFTMALIQSIRDNREPNDWMSPCSYFASLVDEMVHIFAAFIALGTQQLQFKWYLYVQMWYAVARIQQWHGIAKDLDIWRQAQQTQWLLDEDEVAR